MRTIFGDAAAATLLSAVETQAPIIGPFVYGTDGRGAPNLIVPTGGMRQRSSGIDAIEIEDNSGNARTMDNLFMDGAEIFTFTLAAVPQSVNDLLHKSNLSMDDIDLFVFHQANQYMLDHLRKRLRIPPEKFYIAMKHCGNTVSSTIPIALKHAAMDGTLKAGTCIMLIGFGVGYSWGATILRWC